LARCLWRSISADDSSLASVPGAAETVIQWI
jgi:hypothetical protein